MKIFFKLSLDKVITQIKLILMYINNYEYNYDTAQECAIIIVS